MALRQQWKTYLRYRLESSYNAANPQTANDWHRAGGANGWFDLYDDLGNAGLVPQTSLIFPQGKSGNRSLNAAKPVQGAFDPAIGQLQMPLIVEQMYPLLTAAFSAPTASTTAGVAALASTAFGSLATLDTDPGDEEILKFTIASSTAASGATIVISDDGTEVETITIPDSASSVDGDYYGTKPVSGTVSLAVTGTVTSGMVTVSGIEYTEHTYKVGDSGSMVVEQANRVESGAEGNSEFYPGVKPTTIGIAADRNAVDNLVQVTAAMMGLQPTTATASTYAFHAASSFQPVPAWDMCVEIDDAANYEVVSVQINIATGVEAVPTASCSQSPRFIVDGPFAISGSFTFVPETNSRYTSYKNATPEKMSLVFQSNKAISGADAYRFEVLMNEVYYSTYQNAVQGPAQAATCDFVAVYNAIDGGPGQIVTRSRLPF